MTHTTISREISKTWAKKIIRLTLAVIVYSIFAFSLYCPHFKCFEKVDYLILINGVIASGGCYILSSRWIGSFWAKLFAGAVYGFSPFMIGMSKFHPIAGSLVAVIPWLFLPAAFLPKKKWKFLQWPLSAIPFLAIIVFFNLTAHLSLFPASVQSKLHMGDLISLFAPLVCAGRGSTLLGFYHVPVAALVMGIAMLLMSRRFGIIIIFAVGLVPAFCPSFMNVCPVLWLSIPVLCLSVLVGEGIRGLASAGYADRRWVFLTVIIMGLLSIAALAFATNYFQEFASMADRYARLLVDTARMYILGTIAISIVFFLIRGKVRLYWLRLTILCSAMAIDIYLSSQMLVDKTL
ncbi:MAG: diguanylate cyclase [Planctomycetota bacterium]|jgi:hypothetical protein